MGCDAADERGGGDNDGDVEVQHGGFGCRKDHAVGRDESSRRGPSVASLGGEARGTRAVQSKSVRGFRSELVQSGYMETVAGEMEGFEDEYEGETFENRSFAEADLSEIKFIDCVFVSCNLSMASLTGTSFRDVKFEGCKMLGLRLDGCNDFGFAVSFEDCVLDHSSFFERNLKKTHFKNTRLHGVDFTNADLTSAVLEGCDLKDARFDGTNLEKADFRTSTAYSIDPEINRIRNARFSIPAVIGLLDRLEIIIE